RLLHFLAQSDSIDPQVMPVPEVLGQIERTLAGQPAPDEWRPLLETIHKAIAHASPKPTKSIESLLARIKLLLSDSVTARLKPDGGWADRMALDLASMSVSDRRSWNALLSHASTVTPEPPATDWDIESGEIQAEINDIEAYEEERLRLFFLRTAAAAWVQA